jgi:hypothetical protein
MRTLGVLALAAAALSGCHADQAAMQAAADAEMLLPSNSVSLDEYAEMTGPQIPTETTESGFVLAAGIAPDGRVLTLGAGDALGRAIFINDVILAALDQAEAMPLDALAEVPLGN